MSAYGQNPDLPSGFVVNPRLDAPPPRGMLAQVRQAYGGWPGPEAARGSDAEEDLSTEKVRRGPPGVILPQFLPYIDEFTSGTGETTAIRLAYRKMLADANVKAALLGKLLAVAALDLKIHPADKKNTHDQHVAEFVRWTLNDQLGGPPKLMESVLLPGLVDGYSVCEKVFGEPQEQGKWQGKIPLIDLASIDVNYDLVPETDPQNRVVSYMGLRYNAGRHFAPALFTHWTHLGLFGRPTGMSDFRAAYRPYWVCDTAWKLRLLMLQFRAGGLVVGKYQTDSVKPSLEAALKNIKTHGWLSVPASAEIEVINLAAAGSDVFDSAMKNAKHDIFLAIEGAMLQSVEGETQDGAGNSQVHQSTAELRRWWLAKSLEGVLNGSGRQPGLIKDVVDLNFVVGEYPKAALGSVDQNEVKARLEIYQGLQQLGVPISLSKVNEDCDNEPPDPADPTDALQKPTPPQPPGMPGMGGSPQPGDKPGDDKPGEGFEGFAEDAAGHEHDRAGRFAAKGEKAAAKMQKTREDAAAAHPDIRAAHADYEAAIDPAKSHRDRSDAARRYWPVVADAKQRAFDARRWEENDALAPHLDAAMAAAADFDSAHRAAAKAAAPRRREARAERRRRRQATEDALDKHFHDAPDLTLLPVGPLSDDPKVSAADDAFKELDEAARAERPRRATVAAAADRYVARLASALGAVSSASVPEVDQADHEEMVMQMRRAGAQALKLARALRPGKAGERFAEWFGEDASGHEHKGKGPGGGQFTGGGGGKGGGSGTVPKQFGKSKAKVAYAAKAEAVGAKVLGKHFSAENVASLVGAPDDASIEVGVIDGGKALKVHVNHPDFEATHYIARDSGKKLAMELSEFWVKEGAQGQGLGSECFGRQVENARAAGVAYIRLHAAKENPQDPAKPHNGYFTWPRLGCDQDVEHPDDADADDRPMWEAVHAHYPHAKTVLDIMDTKEGRDWWGKNGGDLTHARFDLTPGSRSLRVFEAYMEERSSRKPKAAAMSEGRPPSGRGAEIDLAPWEEEALEAAWKKLDAETFAERFDEHDVSRERRGPDGKWTTGGGKGGIRPPVDHRAHVDAMLADAKTRLAGAVGKPGEMHARQAVNDLENLRALMEDEAKPTGPESPDPTPDKTEQHLRDNLESARQMARRYPHDEGRQDDLRGAADQLQDHLDARAGKRRRSGVEHVEDAIRKHAGPDGRASLVDVRRHLAEQGETSRDQQDAGIAWAMERGAIGHPPEADANEEQRAATHATGSKPIGYLSAAKPAPKPPEKPPAAPYQAHGPKLSGSPAMIHYATPIRDQKIQEINAAHLKAVADLEAKGDKANVHAVRESFRRLLRNTDARFWIESKQVPGVNLLREAWKEKYHGFAEWWEAFGEDAQGHEHKGPGEGGGQFTVKGAVEDDEEGRWAASASTVPRRGDGHPDPNTASGIRFIALSLRRAVWQASKGKPKDKCVDAASALRHVYPEAEVHAGYFEGKEEQAHTVTRLGGRFIDVTADQFGGEPKVRVLRELPSEYEDFERMGGGISHHKDVLAIADEFKRRIAKTP